MSADIHLYGAPWDDEYLFDDPGEVYERWIDEDWDPLPATLEIIEYDSLALSHFLCRGDLLIDRALEILADDEITEGAWQQVDKKYKAILTDPDVTAAFNNAREALGRALDREVGYRMGGKKIASHWITFTEDGKPLYDGEPLYRDAAATEAAS